MLLLGKKKKIVGGGNLSPFIPQVTPMSIPGVEFREFQ